MPDDERLGGTRDPHEYGRRHRRGEAAPPPPEGQPRRRRRSVESGGVSVADLVQRHTGSRPDLTPVDPEQLRQNGMTTGRRARHDDQPPPPPPPPRQNPGHPSIAAAMEGSDGFPPDRAAPHRGQPGDNGFPRDEAAQPRPGGASSYFTIPSDAVRNSFNADGEAPFPADNGFAPEEPPGRRPRRGPVGEGSGPRNGFPPDEAGPPGYAAPPRRRGPQNEGFPPDGGRKGARRVRGNPSPGPGFGPEAGNGSHRAGETSAHYPVPNRPNEPAAHLGSDAAPGFPPDPAPPHRRVGETSAHYPVPNRPHEPAAHLGSDAAPGFPPDPEPSRSNAPRGNPRGNPQRNGARRTGETSAHQPGLGTDAAPGFPHDPEPSRRNGARRAGEASAHQPGLGADTPPGFPPDPEPSRRNGARRTGEAPAHQPGLGADTPPGFPLDPEPSRGSVPRRNGARRAGEASAHHPVPGEGRPRHAGEGSGPFPGPGFPPDDVPRPSRRVGEGSGPRRPRPAPADDPRQVGEGSGPRRPRPAPGEGSGPRGRRVTETHFGGEDPRGRRMGEASTHLPAPSRPVEAGFPQDGRPEGVARRRAARAAATAQPELGPRPGRFPADAPPPPPHQGSGPFPVDEFHRQGPHADDLSEPRLTPAAIDAPDSKPRRTTGVPPVPPPPPPMGDDDLVTMTTEMEAIGNEEVQKRRSIDHTLARFSAVHDEIKAEEREKKAKRRKLRPWERGDDEMDRLDELEAQQSMAMSIPRFDPQDEEEDEDPRKAKKKRRWRKGKSAGKAFSVFIAGLIFLSTAVAWGFKSYIENSAQQVDALDPDSDAIKDAAAQRGDENFLLVGSDTRAGAKAEDGVGDEAQVVGARSDTVMIAHVPKDRERVVVVSFPRDLEVTRPACEGFDPKTGSYTGEQHPAERRVKLNTAYQVGGPMCVTKLVQELSGLAVNHFVGIDFHGFKDMVDAVQGVEVCVEKPMKDDVLGMIVPEAGKNVKLTGDQALNFVRARHLEGDVTSDYGRITRQQRFLSSLLRKAMSTEVLLSPGKLTKFVNAFSKATFGDNIGIEQLFTLGQSMQGVEAGKVTFITIPTVGESNSRGNEELRAEDSNALFEAIRQDVPLPGEVTETQDDASKKDQTQVQSGLIQQQQQPNLVDPATIKLQVLNGGNEQGGIARDTADSLADYGFEIVQVISAPPTDRTVIKYSKSREAQALTVKAAVPGATLVEDPSMAGAIMLIIGPDFDGKVVSPTGGGPAPKVPDDLSTVNAGDVACA